MNDEQKFDLEIDYEHIDVEEIMTRIKKKVAAEAGQEREAAAIVAAAGVASGETAPEPSNGFESQGRGGRLRSLLLKVMSPFRPLIKLLILPVYEEHRQTVRILHQTNKRLDRLYQINEKDHRLAFERLDRLREYIKLLHTLSHNVVVELTKLKIEEETLKATVRLLEKDFEHLGRRERALEHEIFK